MFTILISSYAMFFTDLCKTQCGRVKSGDQIMGLPPVSVH
jgi:hypothetical protein